MKKYDTLLLGVIYPEVEPFLASYNKSLVEQIEKNFDNLLINDGYKGNVPKSDLNINIINIHDKKTQAELRLKGILFAVNNGYEKLIFTDTDDYYSLNYVSLLTYNLDKFDFVYSKIMPVNQNGQKKGNYFLPVPQSTYNYISLLNYNYIGLGNSGIRGDKLKDIHVPKDVIAIDWYIYTCLLLKGHRGEYIEDATTFYRQYDDNLVGLNKTLNSNRLELGINVKQIHYHYICEYCKENKFLEALKDYKKKKDEIQEVQSVLEDGDFKTRYMEVINANMEKIYQGWWSEILTLNEWKKYAN